jgi:hypothetical protein
VDISAVPGDSANFPGDKVGISSRPLDHRFTWAQSVPSSGNRSFTEGRGRTRERSQDPHRRSTPVVGNEEGPQGPTGEPTLSRVTRTAARPDVEPRWVAVGKGRKVRSVAGRPHFRTYGCSGTARRALRGASDRVSPPGRPTRLSAREPNMPSAWPREARATPVVRLLGAASRLGLNGDDPLSMSGWGRPSDTDPGRHLHSARIRVRACCGRWRTVRRWPASPVRPPPARPRGSGGR